MKPYDYLFLSTRVRSLEGSLLTGERMGRMLEAPNDQEALEVLRECGYGSLPPPTNQGIDQLLAQQRQAVLEDVAVFAPDPEVVALFRLRYDYHNAKVLLKAQALGTDASHLLLDLGRVPKGVLEEQLRGGTLAGLPAILHAAVEEAREVLNTTQDPQRSDFILDRAYYQELDQLARDSGSSFLQGYVRCLVDAANLRAVVRTRRMGKGDAFLRGVLFPGGDMDLRRILAAVDSGTALEELYSTSFLGQAAQEADQVLEGGSLTRFEKACDDAVTGYLAQAKYIAFGDAPVVAYLAAKENEFTAVRIIMSGRMAGLDTETIRERLREAYV